MSATECRPGTDAESAGAPGKPVPRSTRRSKARSDAVAAEVRLIVALAATCRLAIVSPGTIAPLAAEPRPGIAPLARGQGGKTRSVARSCFDTDTCAH